MSYVQTLVPPEHASNHVLVLPDPWEPARVKGLADAWFADVVWLREPRTDAGARPTGGARFRGMAAERAQQPEPGVLSIGTEHGAAGPFPVPDELSPQAGLTGSTAAYALGRVDGMFDQRAGRPLSTDDRDGISRAFAAGLPEGEELRLVQWGVAVARRTGGSLLADGRQLLHPDPASAVDLALYSAHPVAPESLLGLLRSLVATAEVEAQEDAANGTTRSRLVARTPYDGMIVVETERVDRVPRALAGLDWREYGPHVVRMSWLPQDSFELEVEHPSGVHVIARARMRVLVARLALLLHAQVGGAMIDDGAFLVTTADVERRTDEQRTASRAWI